MFDDRPMDFKAQEKRLAFFRERYPFVYIRTITQTQFHRPIYALQLGQGSGKILLCGGHHANEYLTCQLLWQMLERYCEALRTDGYFGGERASKLYYRTTLYLVPMLNPDGIDLVLGSASEEEYEKAKKIAALFPDIPFPGGWKANLNGVDLNLNYPERFETAQRIKKEQGFFQPAPRDYPGKKPLDQAETAALAAYTTCIRPDLILAYHSQGNVIYSDFDLLAEKMSALSGYAREEVPEQSNNAGFRDWFTARFHRPGFTIEAGFGENPLPIGQLDDIVRRNLPMLVCVMQQ